MMEKAATGRWLALGSVNRGQAPALAQLRLDGPLAVGGARRWLPGHRSVDTAGAIGSLTNWIDSRL